MNPEKQAALLKKVHEEERVLREKREENCTGCMCNMLDGEKACGNDPVRMMLGNGGGPEAFFRGKCQEMINTPACPNTITLRDGEKLDVPNHFSNLYLIGIVTRHEHRLTK